MKYKYCVGILDGNTLKYVTEMDNKNKTWCAEVGKPAKMFGKTVADSMMYGMVANGIRAVVLKVPDFYELGN